MESRWEGDGSLGFVGPLIAGPETAIDVNRLTRDEGRRFGAKKCDAARYIVSGSASTKGSDRAPCIRIGRVFGARPLILDRARSDAIDADSQRSQFGCRALGEHFNPTLAGAVVGQFGKRNVVRPGTDIDDGTGPMLLHQPGPPLGTQKRPLEVGPNRPIEVLFLQVEKAGPGLHTRVVDQDSKATCLGFHFAKHGIDFGRLADVGIDGKTLSAVRCHHLERSIGTVWIPKVIDHHMVARLRQVARDGLADAGTGSCDQGPSLVLLYFH